MDNTVKPSRRQLLQSAAAIPLLPALVDKAKAAEYPFGPVTAIDTQSLYRMNDLCWQQSSYVSRGQFDYRTTVDFLDVGCQALINMDPRASEGLVAAANLINSDADVQITPERSALAAQLYSTWGLNAPGGFVVHPDLQNPSAEEVRTYLGNPSLRSYLIDQYRLNFATGIAFYPFAPSPTAYTPYGMSARPLVQSNFNSEEPEEPVDLPSYDPGPVSGGSPPQEQPPQPTQPTGPYNYGDANQIWNSVASNGKVLAGMGAGVVTLAGGASFLGLVGISTAVVVAGAGLGMILLGAVFVIAANFALYKIGMTAPKPNMISPMTGLSPAIIY